MRGLESDISGGLLVPKEFDKVILGNMAIFKIPNMKSERKRQLFGFTVVIKWQAQEKDGIDLSQNQLLKTKRKKMRTKFI
jgi:hypothetical protein